MFKADRYCELCQSVRLTDSEIKEMIELENEAKFVGSTVLFDDGSSYCRVLKITEGENNDTFTL